MAPKMAPKMQIHVCTEIVRTTAQTITLLERGGVGKTGKEKNESGRPLRQNPRL
jgi:hypothetical protein